MIFEHACLKAGSAAAAAAAAAATTGKKYKFPKNIELHDMCAVGTVLIPRLQLLFMVLLLRLAVLPCCDIGSVDCLIMDMDRKENVHLLKQAQQCAIIKSSRDNVITPPSGTGWRRLTSRGRACHSGLAPHAELMTMQSSKRHFGSHVIASVTGAVSEERHPAA